MNKHAPPGFTTMYANMPKISAHLIACAGVSPAKTTGDSPGLACA